MSNRKKLTLAVLIFLTALLAGISIYVTLRLQESQAPTQTGAASAGYTNVCGTNNASWSNRDPQCQGCQPGSCSGAYVYKFLCNGRHNECGGGGATPYTQSGPSTSMSLGGEPCGVTVQIDVFTGANYQGLKDFFVYYTGDCQQTTPKYKCSGTSCVRDDANGTYTTSNCNNQCTPVNPQCPSSVQARFRLTINGTDIGLVNSGSYKKNEVNAIDYTVVTNMQTNPPSFFNGTVTVTGPNGFSVTNTGVASPRAITNIQAGTYVLSALVSGNRCDGATITITETQIQQTTCYRCTPGLTDSNACEEQTVTGTSCPTGWTTNSNCAAAATGGACPVQTTCYRCTEPTGDGNACEQQIVNSASCPTGWTTNSNCAAAATGGSCPVQVACGAACSTNNLCPTGHTCNNGVCKLDACIANPASCSDGQCTLAACGDAVCNVGELCERTAPNATTFKACTTTGSAPTGADVPTCSMSGTNRCQQGPQITCYRCTAGLTDGNMCEQQTVNDASCPSGWTTNSNCAAAASGGSCPVEVACGATCNETNALCPQGHTCNAGICKLNTCLTPGNCSDNSCTPTVPVCGGSCTSNAQCPNNHTCAGNKCVLNGCTSSTCTNGCIPLCGGPCSTNSDCPNSHSCSAGKCVLNGCTASTCTNGCTVNPVIPNTAIEDDARLLIIGSLLIIAGYISLRVSNRKNLLSTIFDNMSGSYEDKTERKIKQKAEK